MKASKMIIPTLKEAPNEAQIANHILLIRAGMIKKLVAGVYNYLPMGLKVLGKIENIIREEMNLSEAQEILSSALQPKELWEESGRWFKYGPELMRLNDRHNREFCLGPTHEEIFTYLARDLIKSYKQLPVCLYQIQTKYRDELRPRFGLMRGREFIMKDAYSFDIDLAGLDKSYNVMYDTYTRIFNRLNIKFKTVLADTGAIGGSESHQFMALSDIGESTIAYYSSCDYAADEEKCEAISSEKIEKETLQETALIHTPNAKTIEEVVNFLNCDIKKVVKSIGYADDFNSRLVMVLVRGDRDINEIKVVNALDIPEAFLRLASDNEIAKINSVSGFVGPVNAENVMILVDKEVSEMSNFIVGANKKDYHLTNVNFGRDFNGTVKDLRMAKEGDICPVCGKPLSFERGIEVGQIFKLQTKYSEAMDACVLDSQGVKTPLVMGSYGIGVTRTMAAIIEQNHDEFGICWPLNVAPYHAVIVPVNYNDEAQQNLALEIYEKLRNNKVDVVLDDRDAKVGFKFKDWELIGVPYIITVGKKAIEDIVEFKVRKENIKVEKTKEEATNIIIDAVKNL